MDAEVLAEIGRALGLDASKSRELDAIIDRIRQDIEIHKSSGAPKEDGFSRRERNTRLRRISHTMAKIEDDLISFAQQEGRTLSQIYMEILADQLSNAGIEAALGQEVSWPPPSFRLLESREAESRDGPYDVLDSEHYRPVRESILRDNAPTVLEGLFRQLKRPIDRFLELERARNKGGAPRRIYRDHAVHELAKSFTTLVGVKPTSTPGGDFYTLCEFVLPELDENTNGLESAVQRILKELRS